MSKNAYYFPHDTNARADDKIVALLSILDWQGYGIFWAIIEKLHESSDGWLDEDYERIAFDLRTNKPIIEQVVKDYKLFKFNNGRFTSERVLRNLKHQKEKSAKARKSVKSRWNKALTKDTNVIRPLCESNTIKESKVKESKVKNICRAFTPPTIEEVILYCKERNNSVDPHTFFDKGQSNGWVDKNGNKYKDWKAVVRTWEKYTRLNVVDGKVVDDGLPAEVRESLRKLEEINAKKRVRNVIGN